MDLEGFGARWIGSFVYDHVIFRSLYVHFAA